MSSLSWRVPVAGTCLEIWALTVFLWDALPSPAAEVVAEAVVFTARA